LYQHAWRIGLDGARHDDRAKTERATETKAATAGDTSSARQTTRVTGGRAELSEEEANRVASLMQRYLPSAPLGWLVAAGAPAVATELAKETARARADP
jgi:hypothetical protein